MLTRHPKNHPVWSTPRSVWITELKDALPKAGVPTLGNHVHCERHRGPTVTVMPGEPTNFCIRLESYAMRGWKVPQQPIQRVTDGCVVASSHETRQRIRSAPSMSLLASNCGIGARS